MVLSRETGTEIGKSEKRRSRVQGASTVVRRKWYCFLGDSELCRGHHMELCIPPHRDEKVATCIHTIFVATEVMRKGTTQALRPIVSKSHSDTK
jgi:hypothetical protein